MKRRRNLTSWSAAKKDAPAKRAKTVMKRLRAPQTPARSLSTKAVMHYAEDVILNAGAGLAAVYVLTANGLFDPNVTGVGHQPAGFDQLMALYNEYYVSASSIKVLFSSSDTNNQVRVGITLLDKATTSADCREYIENGNTVWTVLNTFGAGGAVKELQLDCDINKFSTQATRNDDSYAGTSSTNPDDTHFFHIWYQITSGAGDPASVTINTEVKYDSLFRDPSFTTLS